MLLASSGTLLIKKYGKPDTSKTIRVKMNGIKWKLLNCVYETKINDLGRLGVFHYLGLLKSRKQLVQILNEICKFGERNVILSGA